MLGKEFPERVLFLSDSIDWTSGYAHQTRRLIRGFTNDYEIGVIGGNAPPKHKHLYNKPVLDRIYEYNGKKIYPVEKYGNRDEIQLIFEDFEPDIFIIIPDLRFFENEVLQNDIMYRKECVLVMWHIWDNEPPPTFNVPKYLSFDSIISVTPLTSRLTKTSFELLKDDIMFREKELPRLSYIPETVDTNQYKKISKFSSMYKNISDELKKVVGESDFIVLSIAVAARRKLLPNLISAVDKLSERLGDKNMTLFLHTTKNSPEIDLKPILSNNKLFRGFMNKYAGKRIHSANIMTSYMEDGYDDDYINSLYNVADLTVNISSAEGFGLPIIESLSAGTPVIAPDTGGVKEFIRERDGLKTGELLEIRAREMVASLNVPFIYNDYIDEKELVDKMEKMYNIKKNNPQKYREMGELGREVAKEYDYRKIAPKFEQEMVETYQNIDRKYNIRNLCKLAKEKGIK